MSSLRIRARGTGGSTALARFCGDFSLTRFSRDVRMGIEVPPSSPSCSQGLPSQTTLARAA
ncbi:MAG: hypothetical protein ACKOZT_13935 [Cyanobium sp.]